MEAVAISKRKSGRIHPQKFMMVLTIGSLIMMFAGLTSAYIVRRAQGNWVEFQLPKMFFVSTVLILLSSLTVYLAKRAFDNSLWQRYKQMVGLTFLLGLGFATCQYMGWLELSRNGILLQGNPSGAFVYVISGLHALHVLVGLFFLFIFWIKSFKEIDEIKQLLLDSNPYKSIGIELLSLYWHFVDILWIYLLLFFLYFR